MARKIKSLNELPSWFDLATFGYLKNLDAKGWGRVVASLMFLAEVDLKNVRRDTGQDVSADELFSEALSFIDDEDEDAAFQNQMLQYRYGIAEDNFRFRGIAALTNSVVAYMADEIKSFPEARFLLKKVASIRAVHRGKPVYLTAEQNEYAERPFFLTLQEAIAARGDRLSLTSNRAISVNMSLPDDMLVADFRDWLKASRALSFHKAAPKVYTEDDFAKWCDGRYVPYFILCFWAKAIDAEITHGVMAATLFPNNRMMDPDRIRRTIKPACELWLCQETIDALHAQAAKSDTKKLPANR